MDLTIWTASVLVVVLTAGAVLLAVLGARHRGRGAPGLRSRRPRPAAPAPAAAVGAVMPGVTEVPEAPAAGGEDVLELHRRRAVEALDQHSGGQPLCRVAPGSPGGVKESEGAVAALTQVARRHRAHPEDDLRATVALVRHAWTAELEQRDGVHWHAYREGGEHALRTLATDLEDRLGR